MNEITETTNASANESIERKRASSRRTYYRRKARENGEPVPTEFDSQGYPIETSTQGKVDSKTPLDKISRAREILNELELAYKSLAALFA